MEKKILVIDDEEYTRWFLSKVLTEEGFDVQSASTGRGSLQMIPNYIPDLVILDLRLPDMHGIEVLRTMKERKWETKVVILTAYGTPQIEAEAKDLGICAFVSKPYILEDLIKTIKNALEEDIHEES